MIDAYNKAQQFKEQAVEGIDWYNGMVGNFGSGLGHLIGGSFSIVKNAVLSLLMVYRGLEHRLERCRRQRY